MVILLGLAIKKLSNMGCKQSRQTCNQPTVVGTPNDGYNYTQQPQLQHSGYMTKRERKAERRVVRAEHRLERATMRSNRGGCCGNRTACAPPMQLQQPQQYAYNQANGGYDYGYDGLNQPRETYLDQPSQRDIEWSSREGSGSRVHQPQENGFAGSDEKQKKPPAYEDVV